MFKLVELIDTLKDLKEVKLCFNIHVHLDDFKNVDKTRVANVLLDWCQTPKEIENFVNGFLFKYLKVGLFLT